MDTNNFIYTENQEKTSRKNYSEGILPICSKKLIK